MICPTLLWHQGPIATQIMFRRFPEKKEYVEGAHKGTWSCHLQDGAFSTSARFTCWPLAQNDPPYMELTLN
jgi:hypothetical protein